MRFNYSADICSYPNYYPFGMLMPDRSGGSGEYRYSFNGMEKDDGVKENSNSYDFGARMYDNRLGKFLSLDPLADKNVTFSPYAFADDSPIQYIDANGMFRMPKRLQKKYPQLTNVLKNIQSTVHADDKVWKAFKETIGMTDDQANELLTWGKGPKVKVRDLTKSGDDAYTRDNVLVRGRIVLNEELVNKLENVGDQSSVFAAYNVILHEAQHSGENLFDLDFSTEYVPNDPKHEAGLAFEIEAFGGVRATMPESLEKYDFTIEESKLASDYDNSLGSQKLSQSRDVQYLGDKKSSRETVTTTSKSSLSNRLKVD